MPKYKNIRVKKPNGGTRMQRVQVLKSGKYKFVKNTGTSRKRARTAKRAAPRRRRTYVARRRKKRGGRRGMGIRLGAMIGMAVGLYTLWDQTKGVKGSEKAKLAIRSLTGFDIADGSWKYQRASAGMAMIAGVGLSFVASKTGLNRYTPKGINI